MREPAHVSPDELADLVEAVLSVARRLTILGNRDSGALALSPLEALVMRHIDRSPGCTPSELAAHLGPQREASHWQSKGWWWREWERQWPQDLLLL